MILENKRIKNSIYYLLFNAITGAIPFFLLPVLTVYLSTTQYGIVSLFQTSLAFITPIVSLSMGFYIEKIFFKVSKEELAEEIGNMLFILLTIVMLITFFIFISQNLINYDLIGFPFKWIIVIPTVCFFSTITSFNLILLRNNDKVNHFGVFQVSQTLLNLGLSLLFVISLSMNWSGRLLGITIAFSTTGIFSLLYIYYNGYIFFDFNLNKIKRILKFSAPLLFQGIATFVIFQSNIFIINSVVGKSSVGIYSVALAFAAIMGVFQDAVIKTANPWFYNRLSSIKGFNKVKLVRANIAINILFIVVAILVYIISIFLIKIFTESNYHSAILYVLPLTLAVSFNGMYKLSSTYLINLEKTKLLSIITTVVGIVSIFLNYFLISYYGLLGASIAFCLSLFLQFIVTAFFAQKLYPMPILKAIITEFSKIKFINKK